MSIFGDLAYLIQRVKLKPYFHVRISTWSEAPAKLFWIGREGAAAVRAGTDFRLEEQGDAFEMLGELLAAYRLALGGLSRRDLSACGSASATAALSRKIVSQTPRTGIRVRGRNRLEPRVVPMFTPSYELPCAFNRSESICATFSTDGLAFQRSI